NNPSAQNLDALIANAVKDVRQAALQKMKQPPVSAPAIKKPPAAAAAQKPLAKSSDQASSPDSKPLADPARPVRHSSVSGPALRSPSIGGMTDNPIAGILKMAMENQALTVSQLAAQANKPAVAAKAFRPVNNQIPNRNDQ
ncbi:MAG TPA: hypothetical protein VK963_03490, partial [Candidatus Saccharimonadales bacterium]|nr:hypothetical protein [Candidatus Saccharimonadales bacterium]